MEIKHIAQTINGAPVLMQEPKPRRALWTSFFKRAQSSPQLDFQTSMEKV
jgi:hypothetical protein